MPEDNTPTSSRAEKLGAERHSDTRRQGLTRRQLAAGTAWSVPVVAASVAAPAFGSSPACVQGEQSWTEPGVYPFVVPVGCAQVEYSIAGGEGGFVLSNGAGALFTGTIARDGTVPLPLTIVVGGAGEFGQANQVWKGGVGYGNGGDTATAPAKASIQVGAGGGGSAILDGVNADVGSNPPLIVAGGGGGGNWNMGNGLVGCSTTWIGRDGPDGNAGRPGPGNGGLNGQDAAQGRTLWVAPDGVSPPSPVWYTLSINGGFGAVGTTGGAAGGMGVSTLVDPAAFVTLGVDPPIHRMYVGTAGGNTGTGNYGGGNGGTGAAPWDGQDVSADPALRDNMTSGAGGGGGYAGGGGGGNGWAYEYTCEKRYSFSGAGGGGSSYTGGTAAHAVTVTSSGLGPQAEPPALPNDGAVTIRW